MRRTALIALAVVLFASDAAPPHRINRPTFQQVVQVSE